MKIRTLLLGIFGICFLFLMSSCGKNAVISGNVTNAENELLELALNTQPKTIIDTVRLNEAGKFSFKYDFQKNTTPVFFTLSVKENTLATLLVEPGEKITVNSDFKNPAAYTVSGSEGSALLKSLNDKMLATTYSTDSLLNVLGKYENGSEEEYEEARKKINREMAVLYTKYKQSLIRFIIRNNKSLASYTAMYQVLPNSFSIFGKEGDAIYYKLLADSLETKYPRSPIIYQLRDDYKKLTQVSSIQKLIENAGETILPEITMPDVNGKPVSLTSLKGNVILLDFWVSAERTSSMNNLELLPIYEKYHSQGFEVYQVSIDVSRDSWLQTINNQKLPWINVCDYQGTNTAALRAYNVTKIPANYLISKEGEIVGKDLFGDELEMKIKEAIK